jgi:outer membrane scaffolding protein for murein synthesis (MipA/OmpV family)
MKLPAPLFAASALALLHSVSFAQSPVFYSRHLPPDVAEGGIASLTMIAGREYQGAKDSQVAVMPNINYHWANGFFAGLSNGVGFNFAQSPAMAYGVRATLNLGRKESASTALRGMGDIDVRPELGLFANMHLSREIQLSSSLRHGSGNDRKGLLIDLGASYSLPVTPALRVSAGVAATWANAASNQQFFGVTVPQASASGYSRYTPGSGLRDVRASVTGTYALTPQWFVIGTLSTSALQGDAKNSPLVQKASFTSALLSVAYGF